jgi:mycofactocin precursor
MPEPQQPETSLETGTESGTELVAEDLIEEVSIDGMCGVY